MAYLIGAVLAIVIFVFALVTGFDRDRAFYPVLLMVVASYYVLFAILGGSARALLIESLVAGLFVIVAVAAFKTSLWLAAAGLIFHGLFDLVHSPLIHDPGVPPWWPGFCLSYDVIAGVMLAALLLKRGGSAHKEV